MSKNIKNIDYKPFIRHGNYILSTRAKRKNGRRHIDKQFDTLERIYIYLNRHPDIINNRYEYDFYSNFWKHIGSYKKMSFIANSTTCEEFKKIVTEILTNAD